MNATAVDGGEAILQGCRDLGIDYMVSSPGSDWAALWEALARQDLRQVAGPVYLNCAHELLAVDVAAGSTLARGRMQAVVLHAGVGPMQAAMALYGARVSELPMLVMSGESTTFGAQSDFDPGAQWYNNHNVAGGLAALVRPFVKWAHQVTSPVNIYDMVVRAGEIARTAPMGPVYLDVPIEVMRAPWHPHGKAQAIAPVPRTYPAEGDVDDVARMLLSAERPVIVTGSAGRCEEAYVALVELAESLSLPVVESPSGDVTSFPKDHPLHQGFDANALLQDADVVLAVGIRTPWYPPGRPRIDAAIVIIDESPLKLHMAWQELGRHRFLGGQVAPALRLLCKALRVIPRDDVATRRIAARRLHWTKANDERRRRERAAAERAKARSDIDAIALAAMLADALPSDTMYVDETTVHLAVNRTHLANRGPSSYIAMRTGLGQGLGVALGVKLARRERSVACLVGDGAFLYNPVLPALGLAKQAALPILVVVYDNRGYRAMRDSQVDQYPAGLGAQNNMFHGEPVPRFDYARLAALVGGFGATVERQGELRDALQQASATIASGSPAIVNVTLAA